MITESPQLRLHTADDPYHEFPHNEPATTRQLNGLKQFIELFPQVTGWELDQLTVSPPIAGQDSTRIQDPLFDAGLQLSGTSIPSLVTDSSFGQSDVKLGIVDMSTQLPAGKSCASRKKCDALVGAVNQLISQVQTAQQQIEILNAQLATAVPLAVTDDYGQILLNRLESVVRQGLVALNFTAGGLYLLDDATRELHLRVQVGLSTESYLRPPRRLKESLGDLEALVGHPFTFSGPDGEHSWNLPENYPAGMCVPVATHSNPLGTLWFFSDHERKFSGSDISLAEIVGGRLASELEKESAVREGSVSRKINRDIDRARLWQTLQAPPAVPEIKGWNIQGSQHLTHGIGGALFDWSIAPNGTFRGSVGDIQGAIFESGLATATLRGAMRTLEPRKVRSDRYLFEINNALWNCPIGDQIGSLFQAQIETSTGIANWSNAGETSALIVGAGGEAPIVDPGSPLGACPDEKFAFRERVILPQSTLFAFNEGFRRLFKFRYRKCDDLDILQQMRELVLLTPDSIGEWVAELLDGFDSYRTVPDVSFLAIHRLED